LTAIPSRARSARFVETGEQRIHELTSREVPRGTEAILLVEDDSNLRYLVARVKPFTPDQLARKMRAVLDRATIDSAA